MSTLIQLYVPEEGLWRWTDEKLALNKGQTTAFDCRKTDPGQSVMRKNYTGSVK